MNFGWVFDGEDMTGIGFGAGRAFNFKHAAAGRLTSVNDSYIYNYLDNGLNRGLGIRTQAVFQTRSTSGTISATLVDSLARVEQETATPFSAPGANANLLMSGTGARYYESLSGRFISPYPLGHGASMSLYDYCGGDPVNRLDPTGRCSLSAPSGLPNSEYQQIADANGWGGNSTNAGASGVTSYQSNGYWRERSRVSRQRLGLRGPSLIFTHNFTGYLAFV